MTFRVLIVDDEPLARRVLENFIAEISSLELVGTANNATEAAAFLHGNLVDVIFLDIQMPGLSGLEFLKTLSHPPQVILTTAYSKYALEGYEHSVVDYLLKPIALPRFLKAVNKLVPLEHETKDEATSIVLRVSRGTVRINISEVVAIEAFGNYVKIHTDTATVLASETMKSIEASLPESKFVRVHRSYIVAVESVTRLEASHIFCGDRQFPVGRSYRRVVEARILKS